VRQIALDADDRPHTCFAACVVKFDRAVHDAVVGQRYGRHAQFLRAPGQAGDATVSVEKRIFGVAMQMNEGHWVEYRR